MGRKKQDTTQTQSQTYSGTNTYGWQTPPDTADVQALRGFQFTADPRVPYSFARTRQNIGATYDSPTSAYSNPAVRDAAQRAQFEDLGQQEAQALREEDYSRQALNYAQKADVANMTQPRMVQTGQAGSSSGSGTSNTVMRDSPINSIIQGGSAVGSALLM